MVPESGHALAWSAAAIYCAAREDDKSACFRSILDVVNHDIPAHHGHPLVQLSPSSPCVRLAPWPRRSRSRSLRGQFCRCTAPCATWASIAQRVFTIREAVIDREDVHIWLNDGTIAFTQAVDGRVTGAYFEGEGELLVRPPDRMERASLGLFTGAGVLEEKFSSAYLRFNDDTAKDLEPYLRPAEGAADFAARNDPKARALARIDAMRLCISFTSVPATAAAGETPPVPDRLLHVVVAGEHYGVFDIYFDTRSPEQIMVGKASSPRQNEIYYDLWMSFPMRSLRKTPLSDTRFGGPSGPMWTPDVLSISKYTINASLDPPGELAADATLEVQVKQGGTRIVLFDLSRYLQVKQVEYEGKPLEFIQNEAVEGSEMSRKGNDTVAVVFPAPMCSRARISRCAFVTRVR